MKDRELRSKVRHLEEKINWLYGEIDLLKEKHPEGCKCILCRPRANPFLRKYSDAL